MQKFTKERFRVDWTQNKFQ